MEKPVEIAFKDTDSSHFLEGLARERIERLEQRYPRLISCRVVFEIPHRGAGTAKPPLEAAVEVHAPGKKRVVGRSDTERHDAKGDHTAAVNRAFDAVERQLSSIADIQHGEVKHHENTADLGVVVRLFPEQEYGFVQTRDGGDLYFIRNAVKGDFDALRPGVHVRVTRATGEGPMGP